MKQFPIWPDLSKVTPERFQSHGPLVPLAPGRQASMIDTAFRGLLGTHPTAGYPPVFLLAALFVFLFLSLNL